MGTFWSLAATVELLTCCCKIDPIESRSVASPKTRDFPSLSPLVGTCRSTAPPKQFVRQTTTCDDQNCNVTGQGGNDTLRTLRPRLVSSPPQPGNGRHTNGTSPPTPSCDLCFPPGLPRAPPHRISGGVVLGQTCSSADSSNPHQPQKPVCVLQQGKILRQRITAASCARGA